jgi:HAMP domain-containing protein
MQGIELILNEIKNNAHILSKQSGYYLNNYGYYQKPDKHSLGSFSNLIINKKYHINSQMDNITVCYWGNTFKIPDKVQAQMQAISYLTSLMYNMTKVNIYTDDIWVSILKDKYIIAAPNFSQEIKTTSFKKFNDYFQKIYDHYSKFYDAHPNRRHEAIWIGYKKQFFKERRDISIMYPIFYKNKNFAGFAGVDVGVDDLVKKTLIPSTDNTTKNNLMSQSFLVMQDTTLVSCPDSLYKLFSLPKRNSNDLFFFNYDYSTKLTDSADKAIRDMAKKITANKHNGVIKINVNSEEYLITFSKTQINKWTIGTIMPIKEVMKPVYLTKNKTNNLIHTLQTNYIWIILTFIVLAIIISLLFFSALINIPIKKLKLAAKKIGNGKFNTPIKIKALGEINELSESIKDMGNELLLYTKNL